MLNGDPKYIARLDDLINSNQTAKLQSLRMEYKGLRSRKELGIKKKAQLKRRSEDDCANNLRNRCENKHSGNLLK